MHHKLNIINPEAALELSKQLSCEDGPIPWIESKDFEIPYSNIKPINGYKAPSRFPNCCLFHKGVFDAAAKFLQKFPNCCSAHKRLLSAPWFNKKDYEELPVKVTNALSYTEYHIQKRIDSPNWLKDITDYINYCKTSFGQLPDGYGGPVGLHFYSNSVKDVVKQSKSIPDEKRTALLNYLTDKTIKEGSSKPPEINILISTYKNWLKIFPFEISYLSHLKEHFINQLPILSGTPIKNPYTGFSSINLTSHEGLINFLVSVTEEIITKINALDLYNKGLIDDVQKLQIEVLNGNRKLELGELQKQPSSGKEKYIKILKKWLKGEKKYLAEIAPLLKSINKSANSNKEMEMPANNINENLDLFPIEEGTSIYTKVPFEIAIIYDNGAPDSSHHRFIGFKRPGYKFYTEFSTYSLYIDEFRNGELYTEDLEPLSDENVDVYYKSYAEGFVKGYNQFDNKISSSTAIFKHNMQTIVEKVFDCINETINGLSSYGISMHNEKYVKVIKKDIWFDAGIKAGEKYKAWYFVINNYRHFTTLFRNYKPYIEFYRLACLYWKKQPGGAGMHSALSKLLTDIDTSYPSQEENSRHTNPSNEKKECSEQIKEKVYNIFKFMQQFDDRKHKKILSENDFEQLVNWVTYYFENNFELPEITAPIHRVNTAKGNVFYTFHLVFSELHPEKTKPSSLIDLIRKCFHEYRNDKHENILKTLGKEPEKYRHLIRKNK